MKTFVYLDNTSLNFTHNEKSYRHKMSRKSKHILCSIKFFENRSVYEIM